MTREITADDINKCEELAYHYREAAKLTAEMQLSLIHKAIEQGDAELDITRYHRMPVGARVVWYKTNDVGETLRDELLLDYDDFARIAPRRELPPTSVQVRMARARWNNCYE